MKGHTFSYFIFEEGGESRVLGRDLRQQSDSFKMGTLKALRDCGLSDRQTC